MKKYIVISTLVSTISIILLFVANKIEGFAQWYSITVYPVLVNLFGRIFGIVSFSVVEILLYITGITVIFLIVKYWKNKEKRGIIFGRLVVFAFILFFLYAISCGINYHRNSFSECIGLEVDNYTVNELTEVCSYLTEEVNRLSNLVERDKKGTMRVDEKVQKDAVSAMHNLGEEYQELRGYYPQPKSLALPWILSVQKLSGIYSPFTIEANYNSGMVDYNIPFTMCHELSHLRGFMQEEEANFIAYLACMESENVEFQYSGSLLAWIYCTNVLYKVDYENWKEIRGLLNERVNVDLEANSAYWDRYDGKIAEMAEKVNDNYLKANGQEDGVKSYNRMVDLIVIYYRENEK